MSLTVLRTAPSVTALMDADKSVQNFQYSDPTEAGQRSPLGRPFIASPNTPARPQHP